MAVYSGHLGAVFVAQGTPQALTNEPCEENTDRTRYRITDASRRWLTRTGSVVVEADDAGDLNYQVVPTANYTLQRLGGIVIFDAPQPVDTNVRIASGDYLPVAELGNIQGWSFEVTRDIHDYILLRQEFMQKHPGVGNANGNLDRLWLDESLFDTMNNLSEIILVLYVNYDAELAYACYANLASLSVDNSGDSLVSEGVDFESKDTPVYGITLETP